MSEGSPASGLHVLVTADSVGGVWTYALDLARGLSERGARLTLATLGAPPGDGEREAARAIDGLDLVETGLPLDWLAEGPGDVRATGQALATLARERGVDLVHLNSPAFAADRPFAGPVVGLCHSCVRTWWDAVRLTPLDPDFRWQADMVGRGYRAVDALVAPSRSFARATAAAYGLAREPEVVSNGRVSASEGGFRAFPSPEGRASRSAASNRGGDSPGHVSPPRFGFADSALPSGEGEAGQPFVFTAGRLWDNGKDVATLDRAAAGLSCPVLAAGSQAGPNGTQVELRHIQPLGQLTPAEVAAQLAARPVFCSPALYEPFGLAVLEAAEAGCPLVLSDIPTFRELWDGAAIFVPPRDAGAFAAALANLVADPEARSRLGAAARDRAARYTADAMIDGTLAVYRAVLATRHDAPLSLAS
ncbi:glycosyltransferase family 4 protein [uncultured Enterovirga sp.]|uniref:glycosyltransferase family 4 protein n=1 Tax=uncultured Enterovirga sp. TaxID=2026352 RepID=UPI0035CBA33D